MKATSTPGEAGLDQPPFQMEMVLAYEDKPTAERAKDAVERVLNRPEVNARPQLHLWKLEMLRDPQMRRQAAQKASKADILVLSMHGGKRLVPEIERGLKQWVSVKRRKPCALVISLDSSAHLDAEADLTLSRLRSAAVRNGITVLCHNGEPPGAALNANIRSQSDRTPPLFDAFVPRPELSPRWGINE